MNKTMNRNKKPPNKILFGGKNPGWGDPTFQCFPTIQSINANTGIH